MARKLETDFLSGLEGGHFSLRKVGSRTGTIDIGVSSCCAAGMAVGTPRLSLQLRKLQRKHIDILENSFRSQHTDKIKYLIIRSNSAIKKSCKY